MSDVTSPPILPPATGNQAGWCVRLWYFDGINSESEGEVDEEVTTQAAVGTEQQASAAQRHPSHEVEETTKPAREKCRTPGCDNTEFHLGPCKTQLGIGPRQRQPRLTVRVQEGAGVQQTCEVEAEVEAVEVVEDEAETETLGAGTDAAQAVLRQAEAEGLTLQPSTNKAGYSGVDLDPRLHSSKRPFRARKSRKNLGYFATVEEAALAVARASSARTAQAVTPSLAATSRPMAAKRAAPPPKPPHTKQARQATAAHPQQAVPPPIGVGPAPAAVATLAAAPAETLRQKVGRIKEDLELDPSLSLVRAIKAANELVGIGPAQGAPTRTLLSQVDTLLATIG